MKNYTLLLAFKGIVSRLIMTILALSVAIPLAHYEHKYRVLSVSQDEGVILLGEVKTEGHSTILNPSTELLDKVSRQTLQKPSFDKKSGRYEDLIQSTARLHQVSPTLVKAVIQAESKFDSNAISSQGAVGLMQILPSTARSMGVQSPHDPRSNIVAGVRYLKFLLREFNDDEYLALAAYNCGPDAIRRYGNKLPPFNETRSFVTQVMSYYQSNLDS